MKPPLTEQADSSKSRWYNRGGARGYHQYLKTLKARKDRHYAKQTLRQGDEPQDTTKKYEGYET